MKKKKEEEEKEEEEEEEEKETNLQTMQSSAFESIIVGTHVTITNYGLDSYNQMPLVVPVISCVCVELDLLQYATVIIDKLRIHTFLSEHARIHCLQGIQKSSEI
jgi:hypothetical protein